MLDNNFEEELLHKIKDKKIHPKPRWQFLLKAYVIWAVGLACLVLGAVAMSLVFYMSNWGDLPVYQRIGTGFLDVLAMLIPIFWIICLVLFLALVLYDLKHTKRGYKYSPYLVLPAVVLASVVLGAGFYKFGLSEFVDDTLGRQAPQYYHFFNPHIDYWSQPQAGRLAGIILGQTSPNVYALLDKNRQEWQILTQGIDNRTFLIQIGKPARFLGSVRADHQFEAREIMPMPGGGFYRGMRQGMGRMMFEREFKDN